MSQRRNCCCCECPPGKTPFQCCPCCFATLTSGGATYTKRKDCSWTDPSGNVLKFCYGRGWTLNGKPSNLSGGCPPDGFSFCYTPPDLNLAYSIAGNFRSAGSEGPSDNPIGVCTFGTVNLSGTLILKGAPCQPGAVGCAGWQPASTGPLLVPATTCTVPSYSNCPDTCHCETCPDHTCSSITQDWGFSALVSFQGCSCSDSPDKKASFIVSVIGVCPNVSLTGSSSCDGFTGRLAMPTSWTTNIFGGPCLNCENPTVTFSIS